MRKVLLAVMVGGAAVAMGLSFSSSVFAQKKGQADSKAKEEAALLEAQKQETTRQEALARQHMAVEQNARQGLSSKEWTVYLSPVSGKGKVEADTFVFTEAGQVLAKNLSVKGYGQSNFQLKAQDDGSAAWETMQVDKDGNLAFLRGVLRNNELTGSLSMQPAKGSPVNYSYTTIAPAVVPAPVAAAKEEKDKKKGKK